MQLSYRMRKGRSRRTFLCARARQPEWGAVGWGRAGLRSEASVILSSIGRSDCEMERCWYRFPCLTTRPHRDVETLV
jgi:hypothetical protein